MVTIMDSLDKDASNCLIFLIANQDKWQATTTRRSGTKRTNNQIVTLSTLLLGTMEDGTVVAPGHIYQNSPGSATKP